MKTDELFDLLVPFKECRVSIEDTRKQGLVFLGIVTDVNINSNDVELALKNVRKIERTSNPSKPTWKSTDNFDDYALWSINCVAFENHLIGTIFIIDNNVNNILTFYPKYFGTKFNPAKSRLRKAPT